MRHLEGACGLFLYIRLSHAASPRIARLLDAAAIVALVVVVRAALRDPTLSDGRYQYFNQLAVCMAFGGFLVLLRPFDTQLSRRWLVRAWAWLGGWSYSLYLVHWPVRDLGRALLGTDADGVILVATLVIAHGFSRVFERPFLNVRSTVHWAAR